MKVAIVHDYLNQWGGAERVLEAICELYPRAPIYTSICTPEIAKKFPTHQIHTSFMQKLPSVLSRHQHYLPFYPAALESFNLSEYDLVVSSSSAWAKGVITPPETLHICYCHSPMRFVWQRREYMEREQLGRVSKMILPFVLSYVRLWDVVSSSRPDFYVANSHTVEERIRNYWNREADVIYPPVSVQRVPFNVGPRQDFYLIVGRLVPYKRIDVTIEAFRQLNRPLKVVGSGRDLESLKKLAGPKTEFVGNISDVELWKLYSQCRAFVQTGAEDFGITLVEAMAGGAPVIAIHRYGPAETVIEGKTGLFFEEQTPEALSEAVLRFEAQYQLFDSAHIRRHAEGFDRELFIRRFGEYVAQRYEEHRIALTSTTRSDRVRSYR
ncbi:MAG: glycosyltransferase [Chloroflexota bacterium]|nr:glycosyltransferase [Chloroflexota bacterium]